MVSYRMLMQIHLRLAAIKSLNDGVAFGEVNVIAFGEVRLIRVH